MEEKIEAITIHDKLNFEFHRIACRSIYFIISSLFERQNTTTITFKVIKGDNSAIYAFLYYSYGKFTFITTGPSYISQDGEYRSRMKNYVHFISLFTKYEKEFASVEEIIIGLLNEKKIEFRVDFYYSPKSDFNRGEFEEKINTERFAIKFFAMCLIVDSNIIGRHQHPYYEIINSINVESLPNDEELLNDIIIVFTISKDKRYNTNTFIIGQKIIPLTYLDVQNVGYVKFNIWKELWASINAASLIVNNIAPNFPVFGNWFYIYGTNFSIYDNTAMFLKYEQSDIASAIKDEIIDAEKKGYVENYPINMNFKILSEKLNAGIEYLDSNLRLTDVSLIIQMEHVGTTLKEMTSIDMDEEAFTKIFFDFIYGFFCLNEKLKIMHGDIHSGNITLFNLMPELNDKQDFKILYIIDNTHYVFKTIGIIGAIIDFSRTIALNGMFGRQERDVINYIEKAKLEPPPITEKNYNAICKAIAPLDVYFLCIILQERITTMPIIIDIRDYVYKSVKDNLNSIQRGNNEIQFLSLRDVIEKYFISYEPEILKIKNLIHHYNFNNEIKYNTQNYDDFPDNIKNVLENEGNYKVLSKEKTDNIKKQSLPKWEF